ncbi:MAG: SPFH domain-containing protein, partial [Deltaproteobacteria bacterium]|nr:SPFH domain-containing protein [Deltaproteobacteria bacterium]
METSNMQGKMKGFGEAIKKTEFPWKAVLFILITGFTAIGGSFGLLEINEAGYITVAQSPFTGKVTIVSEPGMFCQCFGTITKYREAGTFKFIQPEESAGGKEKARPKKSRDANPEMSEEIQVRFNDGSIGWISGMALFDLPKDEEKFRLLHMKFRNFRNLIEAGIIPTIKESVVLTAALMSSGESYTTKRATFSEWSRDQIEKGTYMTEEMIKEEKDQRTGDITKKISVKIKTDNSRLLRNENPLERYGIKFKQFQVTEIRYETETENLIKTKMEALQKTIAAKIAAERAIQERLAAEEQGKKNVTVAEYEAMIKKKKSE